MAAKTGVIAEFVTGYLQHEIRKELKVSGGTDTGLRDASQTGFAVGRLVKVDGDTISKSTASASGIGDATHIIAQSDDTIRELPEDFNYPERFTTLPNLIVKNSTELKTVALYKIVNPDDIKIINLDA